ncbi:ABC transporter ATP-binding protein [Citrobacter sp. Res13-Sevr-PEB04-36]|uniref:ABC transporter ATP-binding protein n=1 Tax=Citrobacter sp. Res13-Sevr-PEB04-36 TaxID=2777960 RepID=UPI0018ACD6F2|nr:ABC transporter ATP-binding protein [Citrobacter sp. Res13-Sevr-PEB04-36]
MISAALNVNQLEYGYQTPLFAPLTFRCEKGNIWAVLGRNGLGKSTLLDTLTGVQPSLGGSIESEGGIGIVAQHTYLPFPYTVSDVVLMGRAQHVKLFAQPGQQDKKRAMQALEQLNVAHLASSAFCSLSGGQQQLVMIARALVTDCQTLLLDEPCSALDLANQQVVLQLISDLACREGCSILFTTHDPLHALQIASHTLLLLPQGKWLAGPTQDIVTEDNLFEAYGLPLRTFSVGPHQTPFIAPLFTIRR